MNFNEYIIYADESGDHYLGPSDTDYPIFVLVFCLFKKSVYVSDIVPRFQQFKFETFGHDIVVLHGSDIRSQTKPFTFLQSKSKRNEFMRRMNSLIRGCDMTVIATAIEKRKLVEQYANPHNPYDLALEFCMERVSNLLHRKSSTSGIVHIVAESRGSVEDRTLKTTFDRINSKLSSMFAIKFANKQTNSTGLQIADLIANPIGRHVLRPDQCNRAWVEIERKLDRDHRGNIQDWGLKIFP